MEKTDVYIGNRQLYPHQIAYIFSIKIRADELIKLKKNQSIKKTKNIGNTPYQILICNDKLSLKECLKKLEE